MNGVTFTEAGAILVDSTGADVSYTQNGLAFNDEGALLVIAYVEEDADTYYRQNGLLLDADGRVVTEEPA